jgi:hypothetical protein
VGKVPFTNFRGLIDLQVLKTGQNNTDQNSPIERRKMYKESERL